MDAELQALLKIPFPPPMEYAFVISRTGELQFNSQDGVAKYTPKVLNELFVEVAGSSSINWESSHYEALLYAIEDEIIHYDDHADNLTDGVVSLALDRMIANPGAACGDNPLCQRLQYRLRAALSFRDYSKSEVKLALRKILKSVELHSSRKGIRGYLDFIRTMLQR